jgi:hypothetical protein
MPVILLALALSESAVHGAEVVDYRLVVEPQTDSSASRRPWTPGVDSWKREGDCPAFFQNEVEGFGVLRVGPDCADEEIPYAL